MENKEKSIKLHELVGRITGKEKTKVYGTSEHAGTFFYRLEVVIEDQPFIKKIVALKYKIEKESLWKDLEESNYIDKRYLFYCSKSIKGYALVNWKELKNRGSN